MIYIAVPLETAHGNLLCVCIAKDRAPGRTVRDGMTFRADCRMAESAHALIDALSKAMWFVSAEAVPYRTEGNSTRVKLSFYYYLETNCKIGRSKIVNFL